MSEGLVELVARVIGRGARTEDQTEAIAAELLARDGLGGLACAGAGSIAARLSERGYGSRAAASAGEALAAAFELGRRVAVEQARPRTRLASSADVAEWATPRLVHLPHEELWVLALDGRSRLRAASCVAKGGLHGLGARAADPLRAALRADASALVLVHNHPSGDPTPSREDVVFTSTVAAAAHVVGVPLVDHVVVGREGFASVPPAIEEDG